jgi:putative inorganic carbon (HCO3(-)) transporter
MLENKGMHRVVGTLERYMEVLFYLFILATPFSKTIVEVSFISLTVLWIAKTIIAGDIDPVKEGLNLPLRIFIVFGAVSTVTSVSLALSLEGFFLKFLEWIILYLMAIEVFNTGKRIRAVFYVFIISITLITTNGMVQYVHGVDLIRGYVMSGERVQSSFGNPNSFAGWLTLTVPFIITAACFKTETALFFVKKGGRSGAVLNIFFWALAALAVTCLMLTYTRGAWIAVMGSLIFLGVIRSKKFLTIVLVIFLSLAFIVPSVMPDKMKGRMLAMIGQAELKVRRADVWREAAGIIEDFPLFGTGLNTYARVGPHYKSFESGGYYPHNSYLHMAADSGLLGLGAFLWIIFTLFKTSLTNMKKIDDKFYNTLLAGLLAGLFGFLIHSFVDTNIYTLQLGNLMWFIMGLIVAVQRVALKDN